MKKRLLPWAALGLCLSLSGCGLMEDAFKAGFIIALVLAAIVGLLIWVFHLTWKGLQRYFPAFTANFEGFWDE
jgi:hypothetical protein